MGIVQRNSITITILSYLGILIGYVNKILLLTNFLTEEQVGLVNILTGLAVLYAQFSALGINFSVVKFFPFFRTPDRRDNGSVPGVPRTGHGVLFERISATVRALPDADSAGAGYVVL